MKIEKIKYLLIALVIFLVGCSELLTAPDENNITDRPITTICFGIGERTHVLLYITNFNFELVKVLVDEELEVGDYTASWDGRDYNNDLVASGVYNAYIVTDDYASVLRMLLIK